MLPLASIAVDATTVYWANDPLVDTQSLMTAPLDGGPAALVASSAHTGSAALKFAVDHTTVCWTDPGAALDDPSGAAIRMRPIIGGSTRKFASAEGAPTAIVADADFVYWKTADAVLRAPKRGGPPTTIAALAHTDVLRDGIAVDDANVYVTSGEGTIVKLAKGGVGTPVILVSGQTPTAIAVDDHSVYWTTWDASATDVGAIMRLTPK